MDWEHDADLMDLHQAHQAALAADERVRGAVARARAAGHSWELVGAALGITRQSAWEKFRSIDD